MLKVKADDVKRVIKTYLDPKTRTVAIYKTKADAAEAGGAAKSEDPELIALLESLPPEMQDPVRMQLKGIKESTDLEKLQSALQRMEQLAASGGIPEDKKGIIDLLMKAMKSRVAELDAAGKETK
jgi:hypothetical protein